MPEFSRSDPPDDDGLSQSDSVRERIIGLGEGSVRKSYYPQLQEKIRALEAKQRELMAMVGSLKERESELEGLVSEKNVLLREVHHRVKNNLQIIGSLLSLGSDSLMTEAEIRRFSDTRRRIDTIALVYTQLLNEERFSDLETAQLVRSVGDSLYLEAGLPLVEFSYSLEPSGLMLNMDKAVPFALLVSELISNALHHGCPEGRGRIIVSLKRDRGHVQGRVTELLCIQDSGPGLPKYSTEAEGHTMGLKLVDMLAHQLKAEWSLETGSSGFGLRALFWMPG